MRTIITLTMLTLCSLAYASEVPGKFTQVVAPPHVLRGVWVAYSMSDDMGKTVEQFDQPIDYCRMSTDSMTLMGGITLRVEAAFVGTSESGDSYISIHLDNGCIIICTDTDVEGLFLAQIIDETDTEIRRVLISVVSP